MLTVCLQFFKHITLLWWRGRKLKLKAFGFISNPLSNQWLQRWTTHLHWPPSVPKPKYPWLGCGHLGLVTSFGARFRAIMIEEWSQSIEIPLTHPPDQFGANLSCQSWPLTPLKYRNVFGFIFGELSRHPSLLSVVSTLWPLWSDWKNKKIRKRRWKQAKCTRVSTYPQTESRLK